MFWFGSVRFGSVLWWKDKSHEVVAHAFVLAFFESFFFVFVFVVVIFVFFFCRPRPPPEGMDLRKFGEEAHLPRRRSRRRCTGFFPRHASAVAPAGTRCLRRRAPSARRRVPSSFAQGCCTLHHHHRLSDAEVDFSILPLFSSTNFFFLMFFNCIREVAYSIQLSLISFISLV